MRQANNIETEIRFRVTDAKKLRAVLRRLGSKCLGRWRGKDILFDRPSPRKTRGFGRQGKNGELIPAGKLLRLRLGMERSGRGKLTFKGPYRDHVFKVREEFETIVENPAMAQKILAGLGYQPVIEYEKRTELWKLAGAEIYIEELPVIGCFMEIEGSAKNIKKVSKILGYDILEGIKKSYREYYMEIGKDKKKWFFEN